MQIFKNRTLALLCVSLAFVSVVVLSLPIRLKLLLLLVAAVGLLFAFFLSVGCKKCKKGCIYVGFALLGAVIALSVSLLYFDCYFARCQETVYESATIRGTVVERKSSYAGYTCFGVALESIDGEGNGETVILECEFPSTLQAGDFIEAEVTQRAFASDENYSEEDFYLSDGYTRIYICEKATDYRILKRNDNLLQIKLSEWNTRLSMRLRDAIGGDEGALATALLLGNRSFLPKSTRLAFQRAGVAHLLALSGMHVSILIGFLELVLRRLRIAKVIRAVMIPVALFGYLMLTGFSPSTVRAVFMVCILYLGFLLCAHYDSFTALSFLLAILLTVTPYSVLDLSLWMSFVAAASIIVFYPVIGSLCKKISGVGKKRNGIRRALAMLCKTFLVSFVANAGLLPLIGFQLGEWSIASVPITLLLSLPMSALLILSLFLLLFEKSFFLSHACRFLAKLMLIVSDWGAERRDVVYSLESDTEKMLLIGLALLLVAFATVKIRRKILFAIVPVAMCLLLTVSNTLTANQPMVYAPASEHTGYFFILSESGKMIVMDDGESEWNDIACLDQMARSLRCSEIGDLILTQYDDRHTYLISSLAGEIKVRRLRLPMPQNPKERAIASRLEDEAALYGIVTCYDVNNLCISDVPDPYTWKDAPPVDVITVN